MICSSKHLCKLYETSYDVIDPVLSVQAKKRKKCTEGLKYLNKEANFLAKLEHYMVHKFVSKPKQLKINGFFAKKR